MRKLTTRLAGVLTPLLAAAATSGHATAATHRTVAAPLVAHQAGQVRAAVTRSSACPAFLGPHCSLPGSHHKGKTVRTRTSGGGEHEDSGRRHGDD